MEIFETIVDLFIFLLLFLNIVMLLLGCAYEFARIAEFERKKRKGG